MTLGTEPAGYRLDFAPAPGCVAISIQVPADTVVSLVLTSGIVQMENHQIGLLIAIYVGDSDTSTLILGTEPAGYRLDFAPPPGYVAIGIQVPTDTVESLVLTSRIVQVEDHQVGLRIVIYVGNGDTSTLTLGTEPAGYPLYITPPPGYVAISIQVPTDPVESLVLTSRILHVEDNKDELPVAIYVGHSSR